MQSQFTHVKQKRELQSQILPLKNNLTGILLVSLLVVMFVKAKQAPTTSIFKGEPLNWHLIESYILALIIEIQLKSCLQLETK